jgi:hypothetical protein
MKPRDFIIFGELGTVVTPWVVANAKENTVPRLCSQGKFRDNFLLGSLEVVGNIPGRVQEEEFVTYMKHFSKHSKPTPPPKKTPEFSSYTLYSHPSHLCHSSSAEITPQFPYYSLHIPLTVYCLSLYVNIDVCVSISNVSSNSLIHDRITIHKPE